MTTVLVRLFTPKDNLAVGEIDGIRERTAAERIHYKKTSNQPCWLCDKEGIAPWFDSMDKWKAHPMRCDAVVSK